jgi:hypothetical protein
MPDVLIKDEVLAVQPSERNIAFVDRCRQLVTVATPDSLEPLDRVVGRADDVMDNAVGHRGEDRREVAVVLCPQLFVDDAIELGSRIPVGVPGVHATHFVPGR